MNRSLIKTIALASLAIAMAFTGCSKVKNTGTENPVQELPDQQTMDVALTVVAVDAKTNTPVSAAVAFESTLASDILDVQGKAVTKDSLVDGVGAFFARGGKTGDLLVKVSAEGYLTSSKTVAVAKGENLVEVTLLSLDKPVDGVSVTEGTTNTSATGEVTESKVFAAAVGDAPEAVQLSIDQGTKLTDASGKPVTGDLSVTVAAFEPSEPEALEAAPADLVVKNDAGQEMATVVAGFVKIAIQNQNGDAVKTLNPPAEVEVLLDPAVKSPTTGAAYAAGDVLSVWSNSDGVSKYEGTTTVQPGGKVSIAVSHLTSYFVSEDMPTCGTNVPKLFLKNGKGADLAIALKAKLGGFSRKLFSLGLDTLVLKQFPSKAFDIDFAAYLADQAVGAISIAKLGCGSTSEIDITLPANAKLTVSVQEQCGTDQNTAKALPSAPVVISTPDGAFVTAGNTDAEGKVEFTLSDAKAYEVSVKARSGEGQASSNVSMDGDKSVDFALQIECPELTGAE